MAEPGRWRELLPVAYLLTGSDTAARDLLARGLARDGGLPGLVRAHLRRRFGGDGAIRGTSGAPWWVSPEDAASAARLAGALDTLPRPDRTAVVLRWFAGMSDEQVAELVPGTDPAAAAARLAGEVPDPADLPARLDGLAALADSGSLTDDDVELGVAAVRSRRRSRVALAVGAVAVLGVGGAALPAALPRASPTDRASALATTAAPGLDLGSPRGSLVDDAAFLTALGRRVGWTPDDGAVVYAGDASGARWALLVRASADGIEANWFTGPAGTAPAELSSSTIYYSGTAPDGWSATATVDGSPVLLVIAQPGDEVEVSPGFDVAPDGTAGRTFEAVDVEDGVASARLDRATAWGAVYRVSRDDVVVSTDFPTLFGVPVSVPTPRSESARSGVGPVDPDAYATALAQIASPTGLTEADLVVTVLGAGSYPAPGGGTAYAVTLAAVLPTGAVVTTTAETIEDGAGSSSGACGTETHPADTDPATLTVVTRCSLYVGDSSTFGATVLVSAPPGATVQLSTAVGGSPQATVLDAGWGYVIDAADDLTEFSADGSLGTVSRAGSGPFDHY